LSVDENIKRELIGELGLSREKIRALYTDRDLQLKLMSLLEEEINLHAFLLNLEHKELPSRRTTFGFAVKAEVGMTWKAWVKEIVKKINSLALKFVGAS
jgi:hypothetical protein